jgi:uncharacterized protein YkwD
MKTFLTRVVLLSILLILFGPFPTNAQNFNGLILLQVESHGEAWYINPLDSKRYSLGRPSEAFALLQSLGLGVRHQVIIQTPARLLGRILIDVEDKGKAYYFNPRDHKLYFLDRPAEMLKVLSSVGLGINNVLLNGIARAPEVGSKVSTPNEYQEIEKTIQNLVNDEREKNGIGRLLWNSDIARVAREHSQNQADENVNLIDQNKYCSYPFIHHEGMVFGLYHSDRLQTKGLYYQSASAENIALIPKIKSVQYNTPSVINHDCQAEVSELNSTYEEDIKGLANSDLKVKRLKEEFDIRQDKLKYSENIEVLKSFYNDTTTVEQKTVAGWMNSPGHRKNILNSTYDEAGVGIAEVKGYYIITQVFIKRASCGYKGGACCLKSGYLPYCYVPWNCNDASVCI